MQLSQSPPASGASPCSLNRPAPPLATPFPQPEVPLPLLPAGPASRCRFDELLDAACDCLDLYSERGMPNTCEILMFERTIKERNSSRLQVLVARFEKAIRTHDANLAASAATLAALSWNIQERNIGREAPAAENAAPVISSEISADLDTAG
jgi:hypothetical protein